MKVVDAVRVIRSKNAGPLTLTIDLLFDDRSCYERALTATSLTRTEIAQRYGVPTDSVAVIPCRSALAIKIAIDRQVVAGSPGDRDVYGAQQHGPLLDAEM